MTIKVTLNERLLPFIFLSFLSSFSYAEAEKRLIQPYFIIDSFSYSETVSLLSTSKGWKGDDFQSGENQWTWNWVEVGVQYQHWAIGILQRYDYNIHFSKDAAELFWLTKNKQDLLEGKKYDLKLQAHVLHSSGIRFSYFNQLNDAFNFRFGIAYLQADYMFDTKVTGDATVLGSSDYDFQADLDYHYTEDLLFDRVFEAPKGKGFAIDFEFDYALTDSTHWQFQVRDLMTRIYWKQSPYTLGTSSSDRKVYDDEGYVSIVPVLKGVEGTNNVYIQTLKPRWYSKFSQHIEVDYSAILQVRHQYQTALYSVGGMYELHSDSRLSVHYWPINKAFEVNWEYHKISLAMTMTDLELSKTKNLWLSVSYGL